MKWLAFALLSIVCFTGCSDDTRGRMLAQVGSAKLFENDLRALLPADQRKVALVDLKDAIQRWADRQLLVQEAMRRDLAERPAAKKTLRSLREEVAVDELLRGLDIKKEPTEAELQSFYQSTITQWTVQSTEVRGYIWYDTDERELSSKWRQSRTERAPEGGSEFDWVPVSQWGSLSQELSRLSIGYYTQPTRWNGKWVFVQVAGRRNAGAIRPFPEVREQVRLRYRISTRQQREDSLLLALRAKLSVRDEYWMVDFPDTRASTITKVPNMLDKAQDNSPEQTSEESSIEDLFDRMEKSERKR